MTDLLVKLYGLPDAGPAQADAGVLVRPAMAYEKRRVLGWVDERFGDGWASECDVAFGNRPISCFLATRAGEIQGFACFDATCRGFFGPLGVDEAARLQGVGRALLLGALQAMAAVGYGYAVAGAVASGEFYAKVVDAIPIPGSSPGIYRDRLKPLR